MPPNHEVRELQKQTRDGIERLRSRRRRDSEEWDEDTARIIVELPVARRGRGGRRAAIGGAVVVVLGVLAGLVRFVVEHWK